MQAINTLVKSYPSMKTKKSVHEDLELNTQSIQ